jgi:sugar lactone lactonase YvrE
VTVEKNDDGEEVLLGKREMGECFVWFVETVRLVVRDISRKGKQIHHKFPTHGNARPQNTSEEPQALVAVSAGGSHRRMPELPQRP